MWWWRTETSKPPVGRDTMLLVEVPCPPPLDHAMSTLTNFKITDYSNKLNSKFEDNGRLNYEDALVRLSYEPAVTSVSKLPPYGEQTRYDVLDTMCPDTTYNLTTGLWTSFL